MPGISDLPFFVDRLPLIDYRGTNANDQKHAEDRTTRVIKKWAGAMDSLKAARSATMQTLEATEGKGGAVVLRIADKPRFEALRLEIASHEEPIGNLEAAIARLDEIIQANALGAGWLGDLQHRLSSCNSSVYQQKSNITKYLAHFTQLNPRMPPEAVLELPEFKQKRAAAEKIIESDEAHLKKMKPVVDEIERILASVGC